jgi:hypothetical protein
MRTAFRLLYSEQLSKYQTCSKYLFLSTRSIAKVDHPLHSVAADGTLQINSPVTIQQYHQLFEMCVARVTAPRSSRTRAPLLPSFGISFSLSRRIVMLNRRHPLPIFDIFNLFLIAECTYVLLTQPSLPDAQG